MNYISTHSRNFFSSGSSAASLWRCPKSTVITAVIGLRLRHELHFPQILEAANISMTGCVRTFVRSYLRMNYLLPASGPQQPHRVSGIQTCFRMFHSKWLRLTASLCRFPKSTAIAAVIGLRSRYPVHTIRLKTGPCRPLLPNISTFVLVVFSSVQMYS